NAFVGARKQITERWIVSQRLDPNAQPWPHNLAARDQLGADLLCHVDWDSKAQPAVHTIDERVHPNHFAVDVAKWAATVTGIDGGVGLKIIRDRVAAALDRKSTRLNSSHQIISYAVF